MKKLILLLASFALVASCSKPTPDPTPDDKPTLNETAVEMVFGEVKVLKVLNYSGNVTWSTENDEHARIDENGEMQTFAIGETNVLATLKDTVLKCKVTVKKSFDKCVFKNPLLTFGADTVAIKAAETRDYDGSENSPNGDITILNYIDAKVETEFVHLCQYEVQNVAKPDEAIGMYQATIVVPSDKPEDEIDGFLASFAERAYFVGALDEYTNIFTDRKVDPQYSVLTSFAYLDEAQTVIGLICEFVPNTKWDSAPAQYAMLKSSLNPAKLAKQVAPFADSMTAKKMITRR